MIILKGYSKESALIVRLKKMSNVFGFTIESVDDEKEEQIQEKKKRGPKAKAKE